MSRVLIGTKQCTPGEKEDNETLDGGDNREDNADDTEWLLMISG